MNFRLVFAPLNPTFELARDSFLRIPTKVDSGIQSTCGSLLFLLVAERQVFPEAISAMWGLLYRGDPESQA